MTAGLMTVCWKNGKEKQIQFDPNADVSEYEAADIIVPKVTSTGEEKSEEKPKKKRVVIYETEDV